MAIMFCIAVYVVGRSGFRLIAFGVNKAIDLVLPKKVESGDED